VLEKIWNNGCVNRAVTVYCLPDRKERINIELDGVFLEKNVGYN
jgi:hypothetical protein